VAKDVAAWTVAACGPRRVQITERGQIPVNVVLALVRAGSKLCHEAVLENQSQIQTRSISTSARSPLLRTAKPDAPGPDLDLDLLRLINRLKIDL
jgi:hypothetical protein